jgi:HlyD family secretion protein
MKTNNNRLKVVLRFVLPAVALVILIFVFALRGEVGQNGADAMPFFKVRKGPLTINVTESGTIQAREQVILKNEVEGRTSIIYLIEEGARVKTGDLLVELDASSFQDALIQQQIQVQNAEADFVQAREILEVTRSQAESDVSRAKLDLQFANEDLQKYVEGEYPTELKKMESDITLKKEQLERARQKVEWSEKLFAEKYISKTEYEGDKLSAQSANLQFELSQDALALFKEYTHKRKLTELNADLEQKKMALDRVERKARADVVQADARLKARESEYNQQKDRLAKNEEQIRKTKITAPINGMVVYSTSARRSWHGNEAPLAEGQEIRERQELIYLPTADTMNAEVKIHESHLKKIKPGLPVNIRIDALPGREFTGKVTKIAPLPDAQSMFMNPDLKVFSTLIDIDQDGSEMRTGMSCKAEIIIDILSDVLYVPVQAVIRKGDQAFAYVKNGKQLEARPISIGLDNNSMVHVTEGLKEGEDVVLTPPLAQGESGETEAKPIIQPITPETQEIMQPPPSAPAPSMDGGRVQPSRENGQRGEAPSGTTPSGERRRRPSSESGQPGENTPSGERRRRPSTEGEGGQRPGSDSQNRTPRSGEERQRTPRSDTREQGSQP